MKRKNDMLMVIMRMVLMIMPVGPKDKGVGAFENQGNMCLKHQQH